MANRIVTDQQLADLVDDQDLVGSAQADAILDLAHVAVEQYLTKRDGCLTSGAAIVETTAVGGRFRTKIVRLTKGPATALSSILINGEANFSADVTYLSRFDFATPFAIAVKDIYPPDALSCEGICPGTVVEVHYTQGWSTVDGNNVYTGVPDPIKKGVLLTAAAILANQNELVESQTVGVETQQYRADIYVPPTARILMSHYRDSSLKG